MANGAGWDKANVVVSFGATDTSGGSGVKSITYSASGAQAITSTTVNGAAASTPAITAEGTTTVTYFATDNAGNAEAANTIIVKLDKTGPTSGLSLINQTGGSFLTGLTAFYRGGTGHSGSFVIRNIVADATSGPKSSTSVSLSGGWTHTGSTVSTPTGGPFDSNAFSWSAGTISSQTEVLTAADTADNTANSSLTFTNDNTNPSGGAVQVNGGSATSSTTTFAINTRTNYVEAASSSASGLGSSVLTVQSESYDGTSCGALGSGGPFAAVTTINGTTQPSGILKGFCYLYSLTGTDNVGNAATVATTVIVLSTFTFTVSNPGGQAAGSPFGGVQLQLQADGVDAASRYGTAYTGSKAITFTGPTNSPSNAAPSYPATVSFTNGLGTVASSAITLTKAESPTLTASMTADAIAGTSGSFVVSAGTATRLAWTNVTSSATVPSPCLFTCSWLAFGNNTTVTANVRLSRSSWNLRWRSPA